jgi:hypothetical protein
MTKVYAVIGGWDYEGESFDSLRLFDCRSTAVAYHKALTEDEGFDYALLREQEVNMESALATSPLLNTKDGITTPW